MTTAVLHAGGVFRGSESVVLEKTPGRRRFRARDGIEGPNSVIEVAHDLRHARAGLRTSPAPSPEEQSAFTGPSEGARTLRS